MSLVDNPSAFPCFEPFETYDEDRGKHVEHQLPTGGMSLRDYFAAKAVPEAIRYHLDVRAMTISPGAFDFDLVAKTAYVVADAMLKARTAK